MPAATITRVEERTEDQTYGRIPYDVEIKGARVGGLSVSKLPKLSDKTQTLVEIKVPAPDGKPVLSLSTLDQIARRVLPEARILSRSKTGSARLMIYSID
jgi:hypothetical protein